jgi:hypothetical protein
MLRKLKTSNARKRDRWAESGGGTAANGDASPSTVARRDNKRASAFRPQMASVTLPSSPTHALEQAAAQPAALSVRAENVLKNLAPELTGETPPKGRWTPPIRLLRSLSYSDLVGARNCGPQTVDEILRWAKSQGVMIRRPFHAGKSLSAMWRDLIAKSATRDYSIEEILEALERSVRRKNTRIPVGFQDILMNLLSTAGK